MVKGSDILIWFFLAGMIAGAVGMILILAWWIKTHAKRVSAQEAISELKQPDLDKSFFDEHEEEDE